MQEKKGLLFGDTRAKGGGGHSEFKDDCQKAIVSVQCYVILEY